MVKAFGESENSKAIYDEMIFLFPKPDKKEEILQYRAKVTQTEDYFPALSSLSTPLSVSQSTAYKDILGKPINSKQVDSSQFPTLPITKKESKNDITPNSTFMQEQQLKDSNNNITCSGRGRGKKQKQVMMAWG